MSSGWNPNIRPFDAQRTAIGDRRFLGGFDARFHSTASCVPAFLQHGRLDLCVLVLPLLHLQQCTSEERKMLACFTVYATILLTMPI